MRYINADAWLDELKEEYTKMWESNCLSELPHMQENAKLQEAIMVRPTADVVPKSEVEEEIKNWQELYADTVSKWEKAYEELEIKLENTKAEVAREIFEEIEKALYHLETPVGKYLVINSSRLAELKKKYTEE